MQFTKSQRKELNKIIFLTKKYYANHADDERIFIKTGVYNYTRNHPIHQFLTWLRKHDYDEYTIKRCEYVIHKYYTTDVPLLKKLH